MTISKNYLFPLMLIIFFLITMAKIADLSGLGNTYKVVEKITPSLYTSVCENNKEH